jgi:YbgC/YbaW family acyl-CoA thioester hydrolase
VTHPSSPASTAVTARIQWADTDAAGHYHFTTAFRLFEMAEGELLAELDLLSATNGRLPRVHASADFRRALHFRDLVTVHATVDRVGDASLTLRFEIHHDGELCAEGRFVTVLLDRPGGAPCAWSPAQRDLLVHGGPRLPER